MTVSLEFLIAVLFIIDAFLVLLLLLFAKRVNQRVNQMNLGNGNAPPNLPEENMAFESAREILDMLEPLVMESKKAALSFDDQIREKRKLGRVHSP